MATTTTPSFDFNVWLSMPSVVEAWKGTNRPYHHRDALHLAAMVKLLRRQAGRGYPGEFGKELALEVVGLALSCALDRSSSATSLEGYCDLEDWQFRNIVFDVATLAAERALADLETAVWGSVLKMKSAA